MDLSRLINVALIIVGGIIAIYAQAGEKQNQYILILGIVILMIGVYRTSRRIPSKSEKKVEETFIESENED